MQPGWDQDALRQGEVCLVGAGGLGSAIAVTLVQAGVGLLHIVDPDKVEASNLHRQFFKGCQRGTPKAHALAANVAAFGTQGTTVFSYPVYLEAFLDGLRDRPPSLLIVGVDNDQARLQAARFCLDLGVALVNVGLSEDGTGIEVLVQEVGGPCLGCWWGNKEPGAARCGGLPVDKTLCGIAGELAARAAFSILMPKRPRSWTRLALFPDSGSLQSGCIRRRERCRLCGSSADGAVSA
jgi:adenylyltransferase/sulfurtransferase